MYLDGHLVISEFAFAGVAGAVLLHGDDDLAPFFEGVGDDPGVGDRDRIGAVGAVGDPEAEHGPFVAHGAGHDRPGELVAAAGLRFVQQLAGGERGAGGREARVDQRARQQHRGA